MREKDLSRTQNNGLRSSSSASRIDPTMQILHPFAGSPQQYLDQLSGFGTGRPQDCPRCQAQEPLTAHGFYTRTIIDAGFDGEIRVRRYLCERCCRTVSLLPEFALPFPRSSLLVIAAGLVARFRPDTPAPAPGTPPPPMPYQRGQFWARRFRQRAPALSAELTAFTPPVSAPTFVARALTMLEASGWTRAHRGLFADLRAHLLGWPPSLAPDGRRAALGPVPAAAGA